MSMHEDVKYLTTMDKEVRKQVIKEFINDSPSALAYLNSGGEMYEEEHLRKCYSGVKAIESMMIVAGGTIVLWECGKIVFKVGRWIVKFTRRFH